jgi:hypothetical protein
MGDSTGADRDADRDGVVAALACLKDAWLEGRYADLTPLMHPDAVIAVPGASARVVGRDAVVAAFAAFGAVATVESVELGVVEADVVGSTATGGFRFVLIYSQGGHRTMTRGRDLWVFTREEGRWLAVWRAVIGLEERPLGAD